MHGTVHNHQPTKSTMLILRYLYYIITLNIPTFSVDKESP